MVAAANYLVKIDPRASMADASFISCGFSTGYGAAWKEAKVEKGSSIAVQGLGPVGLGVHTLYSTKDNLDTVRFL